MPEILMSAGFFIIGCYMTVCFFRGACGDPYDQKGMEEAHEAIHGERERQEFEEFEHYTSCTDANCSFCHSQRVTFV